MVSASPASLSSADDWLFCVTLCTMAGFREHLCTFLLLGLPASVRSAGSGHLRQLAETYTMNCNADVGFPWFPAMINALLPHANTNCSANPPGSIFELLAGHTQEGSAQCEASYAGMNAAFTPHSNNYGLDITAILNDVPAGYTADVPLGIRCAVTCAPYMDFREYGCPIPPSLSVHPAPAVSFNPHSPTMGGFGTAGSTRAMAMSRDGRRVGVGDANGNVRVYDLENGNEFIIGGSYFTMSQDQPNQRPGFGHALAFSDDARVLYVTSIGDLDTSYAETEGFGYTGTMHGFVYVFRYVDSAEGYRAHTSQFDNYNEQTNMFGHSIATNYNGQRVAFGSPCVLNYNYYYNEGFVQTVFYHDSNLLNSDIYRITGDNNGDEFGCAVAMNRLGSLLAVGICGLEKVQMYNFSDTSSSWIPMGSAILGSTHGMTGVGFGSALALDWDGFTLAVGTRGNHDSMIGNQAIVFDWNANTNAWDKRGDAFTNAPSLDASFFTTGVSLQGENIDNVNPPPCTVALSADGQTFAFGAPGGDYAQVFGWYGNEWKQMGGNGGAGDLTGDVGGRGGWAVELSYNGHQVVSLSPSGDGGTGSVDVYDAVIAPSPPPLPPLPPPQSPPPPPPPQEGATNALSHARLYTHSRRSRVTAIVMPRGRASTARSWLRRQ